MPGAEVALSVEQELDLIARGQMTVGGRRPVSKETVKYFQRGLSLEPTGVTDQAFHDRVSELQRMNNAAYPDRKIDVDGVIGRHTLPIYDLQFAPQVNLTAIRRGERRLMTEDNGHPGDLVTLSSIEMAVNKWAQGAGLRDVPHLDIADSRLDPRFEEALKPFQAAHGLPSTGRFLRGSATAIEKYMPTYQEWSETYSQLTLARQSSTPAPGVAPAPAVTAVPPAPVPVTPAPESVPSAELRSFLSNAGRGIDYLQFVPRPPVSEIPPNLTGEALAAEIQARDQAAFKRATVEQEIVDSLEHVRSTIVNVPGRPREMTQAADALVNKMFDGLTELYQRDPGAYFKLADDFGNRYTRYTSATSLRTLIQAEAIVVNANPTFADEGAHITAAAEQSIALLEREGRLPPDKLNETVFSAYNAVANSLAVLNIFMQRP